MRVKSSGVIVDGLLFLMLCFRILVCLMLFCFTSAAYAKPRWLQKVPTGKFHIYSVGVGESHNGLSEAMKSATADALRSFAESSNLTVKTRFHSLTTEEKTRIEDEIVLESESEIIPGLSMVERYRERENIGNNRLWRAWILMRVPKFDNGFSRFSIVSRSLVLPGWGQFYAGSKKKGFTFSVGEIIAVGGAIFTTYRQKDFESKAQGSIYQSNREYFYDQADKYHQANVIFIACAIGLYALNIADAIFSSSNMADIYYTNLTMKFGMDQQMESILYLTYRFNL